MHYSGKIIVSFETVGWIYYRIPWLCVVHLKCWFLWNVVERNSMNWYEARGIACDLIYLCIFVGESSPIGITYSINLGDQWVKRQMEMNIFFIRSLKNPSGKLKFAGTAAIRITVSNWSVGLSFECPRYHDSLELITNSWEVRLQIEYKMIGIYCRAGKDKVAMLQSSLTCWTAVDPK